jgi:hypothetical protein
VYDGPSLSICYPPEHHADTWSIQASPLFFFVRLTPGAPVAFTPYAVNVWVVPTYAPPNECLFEAERVDLSAQTDLGPYEIGGVLGVACEARTAYATQFEGSAPTSFGAIEFSAYAGSDAQLQLAKSILGTVRLLAADSDDP